MEPIINIQGLGKKYRIGNAQPYLSLRDSLTTSLKNAFSKKSNNEFWALQDINLQIAPGERVGIIGKNGAGKSTLLKILSRITPPTKGSVTIHGRIASLLEVGTGFHPELTGRENIYLNGSILGLKKKEIDRKLDEIIDFSGVERFIDTPLKHFSSGMQLRLAFSVAAHLEPEILLIDEVLAVGDMEFQKKCLGKMEEISHKNGKTILFVSHYLSALTSLCNKGVLINNGTIVSQGSMQSVADDYTSLAQRSRDHSFTTSKEQEGHFFQKIILNKPEISIGDDLPVAIQFNKKYFGKPLVLNLNILDVHGNLVSHIINYDDQFDTTQISSCAFQVTLKNINLLPGVYYLSFWAGIDLVNGIENLPNVVSFSVNDANNLTKRMSPFPTNSKIIIASSWQEN